MTKSRGIGRGGRREGAGRPKGIPNKSTQQDINQITIDVTEGRLYLLDIFDDCVIPLSELKRLGYKVINRRGFRNIYGRSAVPKSLV